MFVTGNKELKVPIKVWLESESDIDEKCLEQAYHLARLPFVSKWVALMPDTHAGMGMPIGGVIATKDVIIPNAVGVDIGCGMIYAGTNVKVEDIRGIQTGNGELVNAIISDILRNVPVGFNSYKIPQSSTVLDNAKEQLDKYENDRELFHLLEEGYFQTGTLGGGNHFIELQEGEDGYLGIMIHTGSRHFGKEICDYFAKIARDLNERWYSQVPSEYRLGFLPVDADEGKRYIEWMKLALDYAYENRNAIMDKVKEIVGSYILKYANISVEFTGEINCHHNYASLENHFGKNVWVHRKGATRVREGEIAVIPGAMGSYSYIVEGLGNKDSFCSSSHGAGRAYSRKGAMAEFTTEQVMLDLKEQGVVLGKHKKSDVAEECRYAYKDIDIVMNNQKDLVRPIKKLKTIGVVKG